MGKINLKEKKSKSYNFNLWSSFLSSHQKRILSCVKDYMKSLIYNSISNSFWLLMKESGKVKKFPSLHSLLFYFLFSFSVHSIHCSNACELPYFPSSGSPGVIIRSQGEEDDFGWLWMTMDGFVLCSSERDRTQSSAYKTPP